MQKAYFARQPHAIGRFRDGHDGAQAQIAGAIERRGDAGLMGAAHFAADVIDIRSAFNGGIAARQPRLAQHRGVRQVGHERTDTAADIGEDAAIARDDGGLHLRILVAQARQLADLANVGYFSEFTGNAARPRAEVAEGVIERRAAQRQARFKRRLNADVEPGFNRARHELHRDHVNHDAGQDANDSKQQHQARHQARPELLLLVALVEPAEQQHDQHQQRNRDEHVQAEQPWVLLVECGRIFRRRR